MTISKAGRNSTSVDRIDTKDRWYQETIQALGDVSGAVGVNPALGGFITMNLTGEATLTFDFSGQRSGFVSAFTIKVTGGDEGIVWPSGTLFPGGTPPSLTEDVSLVFCVYDGDDLMVSSITGMQEDE